MYTTITVKQILDRKGYTVWSIDAGASVLDALKFMAEKNIGALLVTQNEKTIGIFSERDYARKLVLAGKNEHDTLVRDVMTDHVIGIMLHHNLEECLTLMTGKFIRHLPVVDEEKRILGIISIGDVVKELVAEQAFLIDQLVNYITGDNTTPAIPEKSEIDHIINEI